MEFHIALAQFRPSKGDPASSFRRMSDWFRRLRDDPYGPELAVFPETAATGYFLEGGVRDHALTRDAMLDRLRAAWAAAGGASSRLDVVVGFYERADGRFYNSALYAELGPDGANAVHLHRKVFLPTYGVFQEERFVDAGAGVRAFDTRLGRFAVLICEDVWHGSAVEAAVDDGARLLLVPSASPARGAAPGPGMPGNLARWDRLVRSTCDAHGVTIAVSQLVGFEGGKGFAGGSMVCEPGAGVRHRSALWDEALDVVGVRVPEGGAIGKDADGAGPERAGTGETGGRRPDRGKAGTRIVAADEAVERGLTGPPPPVASARDPARLAIDADLVEEWLVRFLRDEMARRRGFERAVVGMSGGVDSSLTAALCARALGPGNVLGILMPYATSHPDSAAHAALVAETFGIPTRTIDITAAVDGYLGVHEPGADDTRRGNVMARTRMTVLFDQAAKLGALPVGTGNKSERLLGYFTWHADDTPPINPLGDLFKTQVWALARHLGVPEAVVAKPASADLIEGQTDEADIGVSYETADLVLLHLLEGRTEEWIVEAGFAPGHVRNVRRRLEGTHWKRNLPTVAMLSSTTIGEWYLRPVDY